MHSAQHTKVPGRAAVALVETAHQSSAAGRSPPYRRGFERERGEKIVENNLRSLEISPLTM